MRLTSCVVCLGLVGLSLAACSKSSTSLDAQAFGGGGNLEAVRQDLIAKVNDYAANGVPASFCRAYASCPEKVPGGTLANSNLYYGTDGTACDRVAAVNDALDQIAICQGFLKDNLLAYQQAVTSVSPKPVPGPLTIPDPNSPQSPPWIVYARVTDDGELEVDEDVALKASDVDLFALLAHEYGHLFTVKALGQRLGDFGRYPGYRGVGLQLLDLLSAAMAVDGRDAYGTAVFNAGPLAYFRFDDLYGSSVAWDSSGNGNHAWVNDGVTLGASGAIPGGGTAVQIDTAAAGTGALQASVPGIGPATRTMSVEFWANFPASYTAAPTLFRFSNLAFTVADDTLGFTAGQGMIGVESTNIASQWIHVVAEVGNGSLGTSQVFINGAELPTWVRWGVLESTTLDSILHIGAGTSGGPSIALDELAIYDRALSADEVAAHYATVWTTSPARSVANTAGVTFPGGTEVSTATSIPIPSDCRNPVVTAFSVYSSVLCGDANGQATACSRNAYATSTTLQSNIQNLSATGFDLVLVAADNAVGGTLPVNYVIRCGLTQAQ
jgi:hypothetical protein